MRRHLAKLCLHAVPNAANVDIDDSVEFVVAPLQEWRIFAVDTGEAIGLHAPCVRTCFSGWGRLGEYAADETSIRFPPKTIYRSRVETEQDFYAGARWHVLNPFHGDWKIARRRLLLDQAVLTAKNLCIFL